jgi:hypothetical protein
MFEATLLLHFIGLGLLVTAMVGGILLHRQYKNAPDLRSKALILKASKPFGLLGPIGTVLMLVTGIGNMHAIGAGWLTLGWLSAKIVLFIVASVAGIVIGVLARKRGALVHAMALGDAGPDAEVRLAAFDRTIVIGHYLLPVLMLCILYLSAIGRLGAD